MFVCVYVLWRLIISWISNKHAIFTFLRIVTVSAFLNIDFIFPENLFYKQHVFDVWKNVYEVENILNNGQVALMSRILYVQARERSSMYAKM